MRLPSSSIVRILKSMPIVVMKEGVHASSQKRNSRQDFPTPGSYHRHVSIRTYIFRSSSEVLYLSRR